MGGPGDHRAGTRGAAGHRLSGRHPAGRPHRGLRLRAADDSRARRLRRRRGGLRPGHRALLVDQAFGGLDPHVPPPRPAPGGAAARRPRPLEHHPRSPPRRGRLGHRGGHRQLGDLRGGVGLRPGLRLLRRAARRRRSPQQAGGRRGGGRCRSRLADVPPGAAVVRVRAHHGPPRPLHAAAPVRSDVRAAPQRGAPGPGPAHGLQGAPGSGAHGRPVRRRDRLRGSRVRPLRPRAEGRRPLRRRPHPLHRRPRRGVPGPRALAARSQRLRRARSRSAASSSSPATPTPGVG